MINLKHVSSGGPHMLFQYSRWFGIKWYQIDNEVRFGLVYSVFDLKPMRALTNCALIKSILQSWNTHRFVFESIMSVSVPYLMLSCYTLNVMRHQAALHQKTFSLLFINNSCLYFLLILTWRRFSVSVTDRLLTNYWFQITLVTNPLH